LYVILYVAVFTYNMKIKYYATLKPEKRKDKDGNLIVENTPLLVDVSYNKNRFFLNVGYRIDASKWDQSSQKVIANTIHPKGKKAKEINTRAAELLANIENVFKRFEIAGVIPSATEFKKTLNPKENQAGDSKEYPFFECFDLYVAYGTAKWQPNTLKKHNTTKSHLIAFDSKLTFEKLNNSDTLDAFVAHLNKHGLRNVSAEKYLKVLKWFLKWAVQKKYTFFSDFLTYKPSLDNIAKEVIFLTQEEFIHLYKLDLKLGHLDRVRDVFCFSCVTGLRYSDIFNLKRSQIKDNVIHITTVKTSDHLKIHLNKYSTAILEKYAGLEFEGGKALPVTSNQKSNENIKIVCKEAGFDSLTQIVYKIGNERKDETYPKYELMSMHAGRRTFVCLGLLLGLSSKTIMSFTGHKSIEAMKPYEKIVEEMKSKEMAKFDF
jgi:integrase